ncbi:hypothetical protein POSPLADRAFT_1149671 [Postia placenta MAD-698-R-SB12]|uniref:Tat pathway signal sequence n=1 Tax=Postia placenta MAD-698-R-SB12 TaxID=670580 RepID=A0A1X6MTZ0_9APHY|nr:hypothetical protein POSPLADRAFT_1149671 [Postia placenta MAD-698-R-SB12]OSX59827.1 hypothetical protein POSPLADRAFT_1149671 [Postia placenta MAD-698-R-SB12]
MDAVEYHNVKFNGTLTWPSEFRGTPSPELDAAWKRIAADMRPFRITGDVLRKIGKEARPSLVKFLDEDGGGYLATLEVTHQLHCLNMLRKRTYFEHYAADDVSILAGPEAYRTHLDHCIEMLRQVVLCTADVGLVTYDWVEGYRHPHPDFNTWHKCRDVDKVVEWSNEHELHVPFDRLLRFGNEVDLVEAP